MGIDEGVKENTVNLPTSILVFEALENCSSSNLNKYGP
jgi:hypothetical protein